jgi:hypothetical protein
MALLTGRRPRRWQLALGAALCVFACLFCAQAKVLDYQVKAVFLFNFTQFVDWPPEAFAKPDAPLVIGVLGDDPFGAYLDQTVGGEKVAHRALIVRRWQHAQDIGDCHILFISQSEAGRLDEIIAGLRGRSILTVGDDATFLRRGGIVRFVTESDRVKVRINVDAARASGLTISSKLLRVAEIVAAGVD